MARPTSARIPATSSADLRSRGGFATPLFKAWTYLRWRAAAITHTNTPTTTMPNPSQGQTAQRQDSRHEQRRPEVQGRVRDATLQSVDILAMAGRSHHAHEHTYNNHAEPEPGPDRRPRDPLPRFERVLPDPECEPRDQE